MVTRVSICVEAERRSICPFLLCSVLAKRARQLAVRNTNVGIAELIGMACHEFMDGKLSLSPLAAPTEPIEDADMPRAVRQSALLDDSTKGRHAPTSAEHAKVAESRLDTDLRVEVQAGAAHAAPRNGVEISEPSAEYEKTTRLGSWSLALTFV